jgi:hypothetical protein
VDDDLGQGIGRTRRRARGALQDGFHRNRPARPPGVDAAHTRALLDRHALPAVCSLGLPQHAWPSVNPQAGIDFLTVVLDKAAAMGARR